MVKNSSGANLGFEEKLWTAADKLRGHMDASEYKHVVLGLIFLKYISDAFQEKYDDLKSKRETEFTDPEDRDEYAAANIFWVPKEARWTKLQDGAKQPTIGKLIDDAMVAIEKENPSLKGVLPKDYSRPALDKHRLGELIDLIGTIGLGDKESRSKDILGRIYEFFLGRFPAAEGKAGGEFYTPRCIVRLLVEMIKPYMGRVLDPCCGSGGMFVQSEEFVEAHGGRVGDIAIYGQEWNHTTWRLCKMNLAIRGIDVNLGPHHADSFHNDLHKDLKADFILANPPFNMSEWGGERLREDARWKYGIPPVNNANYAWIQHFVYHLSPNGVTGFVMANGSMSTSTTAEFEIRKNIIEADQVDCMIALPGQLFYTTQIPVCLWFICRNKSSRPSPGASRHPLPEGEGKGEKQYRGGYDFSCLIRTARELRKKQIPPEEIMWELLRNRQLMDLKFRRQHQIGDYIVDFYCDEKRLVVEIDGPVHDTAGRRKVDHKRDAYLKSRNLVVLRFQNQEVLDDPQKVFSQITESIKSPSPFGRGVGVRVNRFRDRRNEILFIDARKMGHLVDRIHRDLSGEEIARIAGTYHSWRGEKDSGEYEDVPGFCKSTTTEEIREHGYVLTPGRYVGAEVVKDDGVPFEEKMVELTTTLYSQFAESDRLEATIKKNLEILGYGK